VNDPRRGETFLSRWSRRKQAEPDQREREDQRVREEIAPARATPAAVQSAQPPPPPDLPPVESLTPDSDFSRFMRPDVPLASRNAAMKKLFADPHFNVMDGLDTYIDDYTKPDPIPAAMLRSLAQSQMLKLFDDAEGDAGAGPAAGSAAGATGAAAIPLEESQAGAATPAPGVSVAATDPAAKS
jgi:hypothetical protein